MKCQPNSGRFFCPYINCFHLYKYKQVPETIQLHPQTNLQKRATQGRKKSLKNSKGRREEEETFIDMADEFQGGICSGNWWDSARNSSSNGACSVSVNDIGISFGWQTEMVDIIKSRSCEESASVCDNSSIVFQDIQKPQLNDSTLQMMGFDLSSSASSTTTATDWNQALL